MAGMRRVSGVFAFALLALFLAANVSCVMAQLPTPPQTPSAGQAQPPAPAPGNPAAAPAKAEPPTPIVVEGAKEANQRVDARISDLDHIEKELKRHKGKGDEDSFNRLREQLEKARHDLSAFTEELRPRLDAAQAQMAKFGAPAATPEDASAEPASAAMERKNLTALTVALKGWINAAEAQQVRANQLLVALQDRRRKLFTGGLMERAPLLSPSLWREVFSSAPWTYYRLTSTVQNWWGGLGSRLSFLLVGGLCLAAWGGLSVVCRKIIAHFRSWANAEAEAPPLWRRAASAAWVIILRAAPIAISAGVFFVSMTASGLITEEVEPIAYAMAVALCVVGVVSALSATLLSPHEPHWRIVHASDRASDRIYVLSIALAGVYGADLVLEAVNTVAHAPDAIDFVKTFLTDAAFGAVLMVILLTAKNGVAHHDVAHHDAARQGEDGAGAKAPWILLLRIPLWGVAIAILLATFTGYVAFARFLAAQVVVTGVILVLVYLLLIWTDVLSHAIVDEDMPVGRKFRDANIDQRRRMQIALPVTLGLQATVILVAIPLVLLQWGFDQKDIGDWFSKAFFGFQIGRIVISPATIVGGAIVFAAGYLGSQFLRNWIDRQVLVPAGVTGGARDSIRTGVGYLGVVLAGVMAFFYVGLEWSNIALMAGAITLGLGFGLQSIINNFVSGLILLAERPIKVGDWIVVHGEEGFVRRISVRTTEVETFEHHNVIVPNSMLISERLKNCTLHNNTSRVSVDVGVSYDADAELVKSLLLKIARANPHVLKWPEPFVYFKDFGASAMDFQLFIYLADIRQHFHVRSELRMGIWKAFKEAGIEIPVAQHDVHLRDLDWIKAAVTRQIVAAREDAAVDVKATAHGAAAHGADGSGANGNGADGAGRRKS
jgi:potassium-dependent mechanosensitive channel